MYANVPAVFPQAEKTQVCHNRQWRCPNKDTHVAETTASWKYQLMPLWGEVFACGTASPQSHLTSVENVLYQVNSSPYYGTIWYSANRAISILSEAKQYVVFKPSPFPSPHAGSDLPLIRYHRWCLQVWSFYNCSAGSLKDTPERKTNRMWCEWRKKKKSSLAGWSGACSVGEHPACPPSPSHLY